MFKFLIGFVLGFFSTLFCYSLLIENKINEKEVNKND